tara:strand:+ start:716 stop:3394 length:2679 start_codon:yes stop_codon:yes gene_type:complete
MKYTYIFGPNQTEGDGKNFDLLGGKGANLAEMSNLGLPVPPGFTITTEVCNYFINFNDFPTDLISQIKFNIKCIEKQMGKKFGSDENPLLFSVRSGAQISMPGMMETVLNVGLTESTVKGLAKISGNKQYAYDSYRRLIMMYADVVMEKSNNIKVDNNLGIRVELENFMSLYRKKINCDSDEKLSGNDLKIICQEFKMIIYRKFRTHFPDDPYIQLHSAIKAVFKSWNGERAIKYRNIENIPHDMGTAVNIQSMVFGNLGVNSATGVAFTRNPSTGENIFYGEWLENAQGEDVVAGTRTPNPINEDSRSSNSSELLTLEKKYPEIYNELYAIKEKLEMHYKDMQDIEFTIENKNLWMLQTRRGKRNGISSIKIAIDMNKEKMINEKELLNRISSNHLNEIMLPNIDPYEEVNEPVIARGLPAGPGGASGKIVFSADTAQKYHESGQSVILVRKETSPEDIHGMFAANGILTSKGGMTSHAALVARGWGKCCIVGCSEALIDYNKKTMVVGNNKFKEGDTITLNGTLGTVYGNEISLIDNKFHDNVQFNQIMKLSDQYKKLGVRANADTEKDAQIARTMGAVGIGLCRTEHMFFSPKRILSMRKMILATNTKQRSEALNELLPHQQKDFYGILKAMTNYPVTIRLLDPPLHEFLPSSREQIESLASNIRISVKDITNIINDLHETNPMLGHRGCRLGVTYPEITKMQATAIFNATEQLINDGFNPKPEIMIPLIGTDKEFIHQRDIIDSVYHEGGYDFKYLVGTMIEIPRACLVAEDIAAHADFFSFGTNDLTQTTFGYSRDDIGGFLREYITKSILESDPFASIDIHGVGKLIERAVKKGKENNSTLKIGVCGEHGGDPKSIHFFNKINLDYVSCSPFRVPIARLSSAHSNL